MRIIEKIPVKHRPIFLFMMATGCRPSEARAFRKADIYERHILFAVTFGRKGELKEVKAKKVEPWPITDEVKEILAITPPNLSPLVFPNPTTGNPYSKNINKTWNRACAQAGVKKIDLYKATRHSFACQMLNAGVEKAIVSRLLRHSTVSQIERYGKYEMAPLVEAANKVQRLPSFTSRLPKKRRI